MKILKFLTFSDLFEWRRIFMKETIVRIKNYASKMPKIYLLKEILKYRFE